MHVITDLQHLFLKILRHIRKIRGFRQMAFFFCLHVVLEILLNLPFCDQVGILRRVSILPSSEGRSLNQFGLFLFFDHLHYFVTILFNRFLNIHNLE